MQRGCRPAPRTPRRLALAARPSPIWVLSSSEQYKGLTKPSAFDMFRGGGMTERPKVPDSKSGVVQATGGSNPPSSATIPTC